MVYVIPTIGGIRFGGPVKISYKSTLRFPIRRPDPIVGM
ncbi:MAG: hypothetical protein JWP57_947, partial [Spirosoma sp.]|nr:hypothetical protein [Spirosoma sp.]